MRILITGHKGFVGRHMTRRLVGNGHQVSGVDIRNGHDALDLFRNSTEKWDLVIHCAAIVGGREAIDGSPLAVATNAALDGWLFAWAAQGHAERVVYFSSSAAYPTYLQADLGLSCLSESAIEVGSAGDADNTYGMTKLHGEYLAEVARAEGVKVHVFRPFSGYGNDQDLTYPFPTFIRRAMDRQDPFEIWGDGKQVRDWIHIDDITAAVMEAIDEDFYGPVNLGTGIGTDFDDLACLVTAEAGYHPDLLHLPAKPSGVQYRVADVTLMHQLYVPKISIEEGVRRAFAGRRAA